MASTRQHRSWICDNSWRVMAARLAIVVVCALAVVVTPAAEAQNFQVIHTFTGGVDGGGSEGGLTMDQAGNLYGTATTGALGYGTAFKLVHRSFGWTFAPLHAFAAGTDGAYPVSPLFIAADGSLYGTTQEGGGVGNCYYDGCGTIFRLAPSRNTCPAVLCPWTETVLYRFSDFGGVFPDSGLIADLAGNLYGETLGGGVYGYGAIYKMNPSGRVSVIYSFTGEDDGSGPGGGLTFDAAGNLYGTTNSGGAYTYGTVYELTPAGSGWTETTLHAFSDGYSEAGVIFDQSGNLYGDTVYGGCCFSGTVFQLSPSDGNWTYTVLHDFSGEFQGPAATLAMDAEGNLYGTTYEIGAYDYGNVFKLSHSGSGWTYADLHDFTGGNDGGYPLGSLILDAQDNLYGTTSGGGEHGCGLGCGVIFEITP